ncbi:MAG: hypothetical protein ACKVK6_01250, partial [bacterium]
KSNLYRARKILLAY